MRIYESAILGCIVAVVAFEAVWTYVNHCIFERPVLWIVVVGHGLTCAMIITALAIPNDTSLQRMVGPFTQCGSLFFVATEMVKVFTILLAPLFRSIRKRTCAAWVAAVIIVSVLLSFPERSQRAEFICRLTALALVFLTSAALFCVLAEGNHSASKALPHATTPARVRRFCIYIVIVHLISTIAAIVDTAKKGKAGLSSVLIILLATSLFSLCSIPFVKAWARLRSDSTQPSAECQTSEPEVELGNSSASESGTTEEEFLDKYLESDKREANMYLAMYLIAPKIPEKMEEWLKAERSGTASKQLGRIEHGSV